MIQQACELIRNRLNAFLGSVDPGSDGWVVLANLIDHEGKPFPGAENKLVMFLGNVEYETSMGMPGRSAQLHGTTYANVAAPRLINVWMMFFANFYNQRYPRRPGHALAHDQLLPAVPAVHARLGSGARLAARAADGGDGEPRLHAVELRDEHDRRRSTCRWSATRCG